MTRFHSWRIALRIAWRDLRHARLRCVFIVAAMAVSIGAIGAVYSTANIARRALELDSRAWLAGDVCIDTREPVTSIQADALNAMTGVRWTIMTTALAMARSDQAADPGLIQVKAVDARVYPFYGTIAVTPAPSLAAALAADTVAVSEEVLDRLDVKWGDTITLGGEPFRITAVIRNEPDRFANEVGIGMRCILSRAGFERSGIESAGTPVKNRILLRLGSDRELEAARRRLEDIFPFGNLRDFNGAHREETRITETVLSFLTVSAFLALALGAIGVAFAVRQHAETSLPSIAILKVLGAQSRQVGAVFLFQIMCLTAAGIFAGVPLGFGARSSVLAIVNRYVALPRPTWWDHAALLAGATAGILAMAPVLIEPALWLLHLRPAVVLRRSMWAGGAERTGRGRRPFGESKLLWIAAAVSCAALATLSVGMLRSTGSAVLMLAALGAMAAGAIGLSGAALRIPVARWVRRRAPLAGHGLACLRRPGNRSRLLISALAAALAVMIATFEARQEVLRTIFSFLPYDRNSVYLAGFRSYTGHDIAAFLQTLPDVKEVRIMRQLRVRRHLNLPEPAGGIQPGAELKNPNADGACEADSVLETDRGQPRCASFAAAARTAGDDSGAGLRARLLRASGGLNARSADAWNYYYSKISGYRQTADLFPPGHRAQLMTVDYYLEQFAAATPPPDSYLAECDAALSTPGGPVRVVVPGELAAHFGVERGSRIALDLADRTVDAVVAEVRDLPPEERLWSALKIGCAGIEPERLFYQAAVRVAPGRIAAARREILDRYPSFAIISAEEISQTISALTRDATVLIRVVAWFSLAAGVCVLIAIVAASSAARTAEIGIFSALGATRSTIARIYTVEFAAIGALAGIVASILSWGFAAVVLGVVLRHVEAALDWTTLGAAIGISMAATVVAGWLPVARLLGKKPMDVLRSE